VSGGATGGADGASSNGGGGGATGGVGGAAGATSGAATTINVRIRYLSAIREKTGGRRQDDVSLPAGSTLASVADWLRNRYDITMPGPALMSTINGYGWNQVPGGLSSQLREGDEIALFPLLSGG
jgi:molybdopterin converting factor small subunit